MIKSYVVKRRLYKSISQNDRGGKRYMQYDDVNNIVLVASIFELAEYDRIADIKKRLEEDGKNVQVVLYLNGKMASKVPETYNESHFSEKNITWLGRIKSDVVQMISGHDLMINLSTRSHIYLDYVARSADTPLKAGRRDWGNEYLDFMIEMKNPSDIGFLTDQIIFYLRKIQSTGKKTA